MPTALSGRLGVGIELNNEETKSLYYGHRFPAVVISCAVRWYFRVSLSLRDIEAPLLERGVVLTYETIGCWALSGCWAGHVILRDEEIEIALSRTPFSSCLSSVALCAGISAFG
jgi:hypothetical protein